MSEESDIGLGVMCLCQWMRSVVADWGRRQPVVKLSHNPVGRHSLDNHMISVPCREACSWIHHRADTRNQIGLTAFPESHTCIASPDSIDAFAASMMRTTSSISSAGTSLYPLDRLSITTRSKPAKNGGSEAEASTSCT